MEKKSVFLVVFIFLLVPGILSGCNSSQIDINSASKSELDEIINVGPKRAEKIISQRENISFDSLDKLTRVNGIGDTYLEEIKKEGLACVETSSGQKGNSDNEESDNKSYGNNPDEVKTIKIESEEKQESGSDQDDEPEIIKLSNSDPGNEEKNSKKSQDPKVIKNPDSFNFQENKSGYANYGLIAVTLIVIGSMLIKYRKNRYKNEFRG